MIRGFLAFIAVILLTAAAPPMPDALAPYYTDNEFDPGDFAWMRGRFPDATEEQKADWDEIKGFIDECSKYGKDCVHKELTELGATLDNSRILFMYPPCIGLVALAGMPDKYGSWQNFETAAASASTIFNAYEYGARIGAESVPIDPDWVSNDALNIMRRAVMEQAYRKAFGWENDERAPALPADVKQILRGLTGSRLGREDHENTEWLKKFVAEKGWPSISKVGERASFSAWLLAQHADNDPAFQLRALRMMEPLAKTGDVSKRNYAYLYDRVMLKLAGKQRYGTQYMCLESGERAPRPLDGAIAELDAKRATMDLGTLAEYFSWASACPKPDEKAEQK